MEVRARINDVGFDDEAALLFAVVGSKVHISCTAAGVRANLASFNVISSSSLAPKFIVGEL